LAHVERATQVYVEHRVIILGLDVHELERLGDAGIIDECVDPTEFTNDPLGRVQTSLPVSDIARQAEAPLAEVSSRGSCLIFVKV
jgi:hypothetical protein